VCVYFRDEPAREFIKLNERLESSKTQEEFMYGLKPLQDQVKPTFNRSIIANSEEEMPKLIDQGWEFVQEFNKGGRFIMKRSARERLKIYNNHNNP
jgi:hypothetical protein